MPGEIVLTLTMENGTITLNLTRNMNVPSDVPVVVAANGVQTTWKRNSDQVCTCLFSTHLDVDLIMVNRLGAIVAILCT